MGRAVSRGKAFKGDRTLINGAIAVPVALIHRDSGIIHIHYHHGVLPLFTAGLKNISEHGLLQKRLYVGHRHFCFPAELPYQNHILCIYKLISFFVVITVGHITVKDLVERIARKTKALDRAVIRTGKGFADIGRIRFLQLTEFFLHRNTAFFYRNNRSISCLRGNAGFCDFSGVNIFFQHIEAAIQIVFIGISFRKADGRINHFLFILIFCQLFRAGQRGFHRRNERRIQRFVVFNILCVQRSIIDI